MSTRRRVGLLVVAAYVAVAGLYAARVSPEWRDAVPTWRGGFDAPFQAFLLGWGWTALRHDPLGVMNAPIFHPEPRTLTYMDSLLGETAAGAPVLAATGSVAAAYNAVAALSIVLSALFTYRLARTARAARPGAFLAGLLFAVSTYRLTNGDFLNQLQTQFLPLGIHFALRFVETWRPRHAVAMATTLAVQAYFGWYYAVILLVAMGLVLLHAFARGAWRPPRGAVRSLLVATACAAVVAAPLAVPSIVQRITMPEYRRTLGQTILYSADLLDYVRASDLAAWWTRPLLPAGVNALFPGVVCLALAFAGIRHIRGGPRGYFVALAVTSFALSLGPFLHVAGRLIQVPLPYLLAYFIVPGLSVLRAPFRFSVLVFLALAVLAGLGYGAVDRRVGRWGPVWRGVALACVAAFGLASAWPRVPHPVPLPTAETLAPAYRWLRDRPVKEPVLEIPVPREDKDESITHALRQYAVLFHGTPRLDGCSGFVSNRYKAFRREIQAFPDSGAASLARSFGARWVLVHFGDYSDSAGEGLGRRLAAAPSLTPVARFGPDAVYRLAPDAP